MCKVSKIGKDSSDHEAKIDSLESHVSEIQSMMLAGTRKLESIVEQSASEVPSAGNAPTHTNTIHAMHACT